MSQVLFTVCLPLRSQTERNTRTNTPACPSYLNSSIPQMPPSSISSPPHPAVISLWIVAPRCFVGLTKSPVPGWTGYIHTAQAEVNKEREQRAYGYITPRCYGSVLPDLAPCVDNITLWKPAWHPHLQPAKSENTTFSLRFSFSHPNLSFSKMQT